MTKPITCVAISAAASALALASASAQDVEKEQRFFPDEPLWAERFAVDVAGAPLAGLDARQVPHPGPSAAPRYEVTLKGQLAGFDVGRVFLDAAVGEDAYAIRYRMEQRGVARWFSDGQAEARGSGTFAGREIDGSYYYNHDYEAEDDQQRVELYRPTGERRLRLWTAPEYWFYEPVPEAMAWRATDPMGALITLGFPAADPGKSPCERVAKVYDGRKRFDLRFEPAGTARLRRGGKGRYEGETHRCKMTLTKVAGYRPKDRGEDEGDLYVFLAPVPAEARSATFSYVPVRVEAKRGMIGGKLEAKYPKITLPDGEVIALYDR